VAVAEKIARQTHKRAALVPDYICNVVHMALERVGFTAVPYLTDGACEASAAETEAAIRDCHPALLLTANIFGSSAMLDWLSLPATRKFFIEQKVFVVVDLCQDIRLIKHLPADYGQWLDAIVSFNDKSFPGAMGGGVITAGGVEAPQGSLKLGQILALYYHLAWKWARVWHPGTETNDPSDFERSTCSAFPNRLERYHPGRVQLIMAVLGLRQLDLYTSRKRALLADHSNSMVHRRFADTAPFLIFEGGKTPPPERRRKKPYAVPSDVGVSLRPRQIIIHNKGFCDTISYKKGRAHD
jgi:hypothetical protein